MNLAGLASSYPGPLMLPRTLAPSGFDAPMDSYLLNVFGMVARDACLFIVQKRRLRFSGAPSCAPDLCCSLSDCHLCSLRSWASWEFVLPIPMPISAFPGGFL